MRTLEKSAAGNPPREVEPSLVAGLLPPHDLDAEAAVISAMMLSKDARDVAVEILLPEKFYSDANNKIFEAIVAVEAERVAVDIVSVCNWLRDRDRLQLIGGPSYLAQLSDATPSIGHVRDHAKIVQGKWRLRRLIAKLQILAAESYTIAGDPEEHIANVVEAIATFADDRASDDAASAAQQVEQARRTLDDVLTNGSDEEVAMAKAQLSMATQEAALIKTWGSADNALVIVTRKFARMTNQIIIPGIKTGLEDVDSVLGDIRSPEVVVIAAHPGCGKSALGVQIAHGEALSLWREANPKGVESYTWADEVIVFTAEMSAEAMLDRTLFGYAGLDTAMARSPKRIEPRHWDDLIHAAPDVAIPNLRIVEVRDMDWAQIAARARRIRAEAMARKRRVRLMVFDYIQILKEGATTRKSDTREQAISRNSRAIALLSVQMQCPSIVLAQLNDDSSSRSDRRPQASDARECKGIWNDADKFLIIWAPHALERSREGSDEKVNEYDHFPPEEAAIIVDKNRGGRVGTRRVAFYPSTTKFAGMTLQLEGVAKRFPETVSGRRGKRGS